MNRPERKGIAVVIFGYKRKIKYLADYYFIDYSWKQDKVVKSIGDGQVIKRPVRYGLNKNIISGINEVFKFFDIVIVLEDDLILKEGALEFLTDNLIALKDDKRYGSVSCVKGDAKNEAFRCWAWGTWKDRWESIDWTVSPKGKNSDSWDVILDEYFKQAGLYCRCSETDLVKHVGWNGTHYKWYNILLKRIRECVNYSG